MKSEPTLYRLIDIDSDDPEYGLGNSGTMYRGHVEPVEACEHGRIDSHWITAALWCPGAGIGGDDETG